MNKRAPERTPGHRLTMDGAPGNLTRAQWRCECGQWTRDGTPERGPYGATTSAARIAQVQMAHGKHIRFALRRAATAEAA